jgi:hypothetical protein
MQALAREFVKQLNEENDVTPVLEKYASSDAPDCLLEELNDDSEVARLDLTPSEVKRFMAAQLNLYYFDAITSGKHREPLVPKDLSSRYAAAGDTFLHPDEGATKVELLNKLGQLETVGEEVRAFLRAHPVKMAKSARSDFRVHMEGTGVCTKRRPEPTEYYTVETPVGMMLFMFKDGEDFKILTAGPNVD